MEDEIISTESREMAAGFLATQLHWRLSLVRKHKNNFSVSPFYSNDCRQPCFVVLVHMDNLCYHIF